MSLALAATGSTARAAEGGRDKRGAIITKTKIRQLGRMLAPRNTLTAARLERFERLDMTTLNQARTARGQAPITAVLLDVDETMAAHHGPVPAVAKQKIRGLIAAGVTVGIYSNANSNVTPVRAADLAELRRAGVHVLGDTTPSKPLKAGFDRAVDELIAHGARRGATITRAQIAMFGDNHMSDGGAIQVGVAFVKVKPVETDNTQFRRPTRAFLKRSTQRAMRAYANGVSRLHDRVVPGRARPIALD